MSSNNTLANQAYWNIQSATLLSELNSKSIGLSKAEASARLALQRKKIHVESALWKDIKLYLSQFKSPLVMLLLAAVLISAFMGEKSDVIIILFILISTGTLSFFQERHAGKAVEKLREIIRTLVDVKRDGNLEKVYTEEVVPGDVLVLKGGDILPADAILLVAHELHTNEAALTGETFPAEKSCDLSAKDAPMAKRSNMLFQGTSVVSGTGEAVVVCTGSDTVLGKLASGIASASEETSFEKGIRHFGYMLMVVTLILSVGIFIINTYFDRPVLESALFCLALAVGMAPELLPAIMTIAMSTGAKRMAEKKVVVKKLSAIQNLGEVNLFCSDKTGTLTEGVLKVNEAVDGTGKESAMVRRLAYINAMLQKGYPNPLDDALKQMPDISLDNTASIGEISYDFLRKRLSVAVENKDGKMLISKGALSNILATCSKIDLGDGNIQTLAPYQQQVDAQYLSYSNQGFRTIGVCYRKLEADEAIDAQAEKEMIYAGMLLLFDPPKEGVIDIIQELKSNGVALKVITGDNRLIAQYMADKIGLKDIVMLAGPDMAQLSEAALAERAALTNVFAEIEPQQKERIIKALRNANTTVAYMGDGINDVAAIHAADVGISTNNAVDVAKEAADVVLLEKDLSVLNAGIMEGRRTFLNTIKYIYINTSATFGNMFSVAGASLLLPFLPMLPKQILMTNFLTDFPYMSVASDSVDEELLKVPQRWDMKRIRRFMLLFGIHSSLFDFLTFFILYKLLHSNEHQFRSGWFLESVATELLILFIVRTHKSILKSKPGKLLLILNIAAMIITFVLPYTPLADALELKQLPLHTLSAIGGILLVYVITADLLKVWFFRKLSN